MAFPAVEREPMALLEQAQGIADSRDMHKPLGLEWGMRSVEADLTSRSGFRWPFPGNWAECDHPLESNSGPCPIQVGDGLCVGLTWEGMAQGGRPAHTLLIVGWLPEDVLGQDREKVRVSRAYVRDVIDGCALIKGHGAGANLSGANLYGADLSRADLSRANLYGAALYGADLYGANLSRANLSGADLYGANLYGAALSGADLHGANLSRANLSRANLYGADLSRANLYGANLSESVGGSQG
jgi:hypothetical protein